MFIMPSSSGSPFIKIISSVVRALLASPLANSPIIFKLSSEIFIFSLPNPLSSVIALFRSFIISSVDSSFKTNTLHLERRALFTSNDGFSVVAPIRTIDPFSTNGKKASCWALLNLCISSTNTIVLIPSLLLLSASSITFFISLIPDVTAENVMNSDFVCLAIILASVVLPTPGGPQNIIEVTLSLSIIFRSIFPSPIKCFCPTNSSKFTGLMREASGSLLGDSNIDC